MVSRVVNGSNANNASLDQLTGPEVYRVAVRVICGTNSSYGPATPFNEFAIAQAPTALVGKVNVTTPFNGSYTLALLKWNPIPWTQWNGDPIGYWICLGEKTNTNFTACKILVNDSSRTQYLVADLKTNTPYYVGVKAVSTGGTGPGPSPSDVTMFMTSSPTTVTEDFLRSAYVYMLVPAAVFTVVIVLMVVVVCKRESERKKQVTYCKGIYNPSSSNGVPPFHRSTTAQSDVRASQHNRPLPLPNSPAHNNNPPPSSLVHQHSQGTFINTVPSASALTRVPPSSNATMGGGGHHGDLASEPPGGARGNLETGSVLSSSVFSGVQSYPASFPATAVTPQHPRDRSQTIAGGIPSPYEVPGSTLPRGEHTSRSFSMSAQGARDYYPPSHPIHSPPLVVGVGHDPIETFGRVPPAGIHQPIPQVRSAGMIAPLPSGGEHDRGVVSMHRNGSGVGLGGGGGYHGPTPQHSRPQDTILESSGEIVYIERPPEGANDSLHRDPPQLDPYSVGTGVEYTNGSILTTAGSDHYSSYSEVTEPNSLAQRMPHSPYHPPHHDRHRPTRDSEFSETSSFSGSSGSLRARSPPRGRGVASGWDQEYRGGAMSEVGHQRERSMSPADHRSEVGGALPRNRKQSQGQTQPMQRPSISHNSSSKLIPMTTNMAIN